MSSQHRHRKRFGQNFLHDQNVIARIIDAVNPQIDDQIIEIGPGQGALTLPLLEKLQHLDVIEIDRDLVAWWRQQGHGNLTIHECDALKVDYCELRQDKQRKVRIVGNLPYNISTPLLFHLFVHCHCITDMHFMLQKEVVERITAAPGSKNYGRLSIMVQFYCETTSLMTIGPGAFQPPPRVDSAVILLRPYQVAPVTADPSVLYKVVTQAFSQRRKTLRNSLKSMMSEDDIKALQIDPACRPETLSLSEFARIARFVSQRNPRDRYADR